MIIYHIHHIVPKHMGGTDDPSNLIKLTIEEHSEAHRILYETYGNEYDKIAWLGLKKAISEQEITYLKQIESGKVSMRNNPNLPSIGGKALWAKPGMKEHLSKKRRDQSANGKNPMQNKQQSRVSCLCCKREWPINNFSQHIKRQL